MKTVSALFLVLLVAGCANRQPTVSETRVQSTPVGGAATGTPFCLHIRYSNEFKYAFTQNNADAWVTDGTCDVQGPRRAVADLVVRWRYRNDKPGNKFCAGADTCSLDEQNIGEGKVLACASGSARDAGHEAGTSTDWYGCPK